MSSHQSGKALKYMYYSLHRLYLVITTRQYYVSEFFSCCYRENTTYWKVKDIDPLEQRSDGHCPLTPKEVGMFLSALGYPSSTPVYIAAGEIYGGESHMVELQSRFPILMSKV
jgi:hypothetical protein